MLASYRTDDNVLDELIKYAFCTVIKKKNMHK